MVGGLDNQWIRRRFGAHNGQATLDPINTDNYVLHFPQFSWHSDFFSTAVQNLDSEGMPLVVKFKYLGLDSTAGGCIGYEDGTSTSLTNQTWVLCDDGSIMEAKGEWVSCQFEVPAAIGSFRIVVAINYDIMVVDYL